MEDEEEKEWQWTEEVEEVTKKEEPLKDWTWSDARNIDPYYSDNSLSWGEGWRLEERGWKLEEGWRSPAGGKGGRGCQEGLLLPPPDHPQR